MIDQTSQLDLITLKEAQGEGLGASINAPVPQPMARMFSVPQPMYVCYAIRLWPQRGDI